MIESLRAKVDALHLEAIESFWHEVKVVGTPIYEPITGNDQEVLATFLWRGDDETYNVALFSRLKFDEEGFAIQQLHRLHGTDVWYLTLKIPVDVRVTYWFSPNDSLVRWTKFEDWGKREHNFYPDPFNPQQFGLPNEGDRPDHKRPFSVISAPHAPKQLYFDKRDKVATGKVEKFTVKSEILGNERPVWVYTPADYAGTAEPYNLLLIFDGWAAVKLLHAPVTLDNMREEKVIPPVVAVMMDYAKGEDRIAEMSCNDQFCRFVAEELLIWIRENYRVSLNPQDNLISGISISGLGAAYTAFKAPEFFGKVLTQSGSFWWKPLGEFEPEWFTRQIVDSPVLPVQFYLSPGKFESRIFSPAEVSLVSSNRHLRDVLRAKGYKVGYYEYPGYHEYVGWRGSFAEGLRYLLGQKKTDELG
jgi:enterochelin esterase family protein